MYRFLQWLQKWGYGNERQMEVFTDMCRNKDVQQLTFESYMHKRMTRVPWVAQMRMTADILAAQVRHYLLPRKKKDADLMQPFYQPVLFALFVWWFVTGLVFVAYGRSPRITHLYFLAATVVMLLAVAGFIYALEVVTPVGVYLSLTCGIFIWGWQVASYYLGYITGPEQSAHFYEMVGMGVSLPISPVFAMPCKPASTTNCSL